MKYSDKFAGLITPGTIVVCVDDEFSQLTQELFPELITKGEVYTIQHILPTKNGIGITLEEFLPLRAVENEEIVNAVLVTFAVERFEPIGHIFYIEDLFDDDDDEEETFY